MKRAFRLAFCLSLLALAASPGLRAQPGTKDADPSKNPAAVLSVRAAELSVRRDGPGLAKLAEEMAKLDPPHRLLGRVRLQAALVTGKGEGATDDYRAAFKSAPDAAARQAIRAEYLRGMARLGRAVDAYRAFPGGSESFRVLADQLVASGLPDRNAALAEEHREHFPDDPALAVYAGQAAFEAKDHASAHRHWSGAFAAIDDAPWARAFRNRRIHAAVAAGKWDDIARQLGGPSLSTTVLADVAETCLELNRLDDFDALLQKHPIAAVLLESLRLERLMRGNAKLDLKTLLTPPESGTVASKNAKLAQTFQALARHGRALDAYREAPDSRAFQALAGVLWAQHNLRDLRRLIELHKDNVANDPKLAYYQGAILIEERQFARGLELINQSTVAPAVGVALKGRLSVALTSDFVDSYYEARLATATVEAILAEDPGAITYIARHFIERRDAAGLAKAIEAQPKAKAGAWPLAAGDWDYTIDLALLEGNPQKAIDRFVDAAPPRKGFQFPANPPAKQPANPPVNPAAKQPVNGFPKSVRKDPESLRSAEPELMRKLIPFGEGMRGYRISKNPDQAFSVLANYYVRERNVAGLRELIAEHRGRAAEDPQLALFEGDLAGFEGRLFEAEELYHKAVPRTADKETHYESQVHHRLLALAIKKGRVLETYRAGGGDSETFLFVALLCLQAKDSAALDAVLDLHRTRFPRDPKLNHIAAKADILRGDFEAAWKRMTPADLVFEPEREDAIVCLLKLKRPGEAVAVVRDWETNTRLRHSALPVVLAYAASGEAKEVLRLMERHAYQDQNLARFYRHELLGPLLRGEAMASVRERFPEPKAAK